MSKEVLLGVEARDSLQQGLDTLANAVKATLGPRGRHAAIERGYGPPLITKDGVTVAKAIQLNDRLQNMGASLIKSVASSQTLLPVMEPLLQRFWLKQSIPKEELWLQQDTILFL